MKGKYLLNNLKKKDKKEGLTLVITFSRLIFVEIFFNNLKDIEMPRKDVHLLLYDNTTDSPLAEALLKKVEEIKDQFKSVRFFKSNLAGRGNIRGSGNDVFKFSKLHNIWDMWKKIFVVRGGMVFTETFFQLEDDTVSPPNCFKKMYKTLLSDEKIALVTGIETGRGPIPWIPVGLGVHNMKMDGLFCLERHSLNPNTKGTVEVDGTGVYCFVARTQAYKKGFEDYDPVKLNVPFFGLDNIFIWNIKRKGFRILADFDIWCIHLNTSGVRIIAFGKEQAVEMMSIWLPQCNNYAQGVHVKGDDFKPKRYKVQKHAPSWEI